MFSGRFDLCANEAPADTDDLWKYVWENGRAQACRRRIQRRAQAGVAPAMRHEGAAFKAPRQRKRSGRSSPDLGYSSVE
jgi:hypothetical protein